MVLLDPEIPDGMARTSHRRQKLRLAVLQGLPPLRVARADREDAMAQIQGSAVIRQGAPC